MSAGYLPPADARRAASVLLVRDGPTGLEVLMLRRAERDGDPRGGAAVFPGGVLDPRDAQAGPWCLGPGDEDASRLLGVASGGLGYYVAAVRETFEEVGLLLAERVADAAAAPIDVVSLYPHREPLNDGALSAAEFAQAQGLRWDLRGLVYYSHWLTPRTVAKRFDTRFFIAHAPEGQQAQADMGEAVELMWLTPAAALDPRLRLKLMPVTMRTLQDLARQPDAASALEAARQRQHAVTLIEPRVAQNAKGRQVVLPGDLPWAEVGRLDPEGIGTSFCDLLPGRVVQLSPRVLRVTAPNPGPMTGPGTNSYLVAAAAAAADGQRHWTVIDPGPDGSAGGDRHLQALLAAAGHGGPGRITQILVTHTHRDHSPLAAALAQATGAPVFGRVAAHPMWQDAHFAPQRQLQHGERLALGEGCTLRVVHTPGHASNHLCYLLEEELTLFTGDHVMQGSTVVINPPDGDMVAYLQALSALLDEPLQWLAPGHGFLVEQPHQVLRDLIAHRLRRHGKVGAALAAAGRATLDELLPLVYDDVPVALHGVARRSLLAHVLKLQHDGQAAREGHADDGPWHWTAAA